MDALNEDFISWLSEAATRGEVFVFRKERDPQTRITAFKVEAIPQTPRFRWGLIVGDTIQNLRSALDHLAWELAYLNSPHRDRVNDRSTQFPIAMSASHFASTSIQKQVQFIHPDHIRMIEEKQPYFGRKGDVSDHTLATLHRLSNDDKHKGIHVVLFAPDLSSFPLSFEKPPFVPSHPGTLSYFVIAEVPLVKGTKFMWVRFDPKTPGGPQPEVDVQGSFLPSIAIQPGGMLKYVLPNITQTVADILKTFEPLL
jgi:hypothetical protein